MHTLVISKNVYNKFAFKYSIYTMCNEIMYNSTHSTIGIFIEYCLVSYHSALTTYCRLAVIRKTYTYYLKQYLYVQVDESFIDTFNYAGAKLFENVTFAVTNLSEMETKLLGASCEHKRPYFLRSQNNKFCRNYFAPVYSTV